MTPLHDHPQQANIQTPRLVVAGGWEWGMTVSWEGNSFWDKERVLKLDSGVGCTTG